VGRYQNIVITGKEIPEFLHKRQLSPVRFFLQDCLIPADYYENVMTENSVCVIEKGKSVISTAALLLAVLLPLAGSDVLQSRVSVDFSTSLLAVALSETEAFHQTQRIILAPSVAGQQAGSQVLDTRIPAGNISFTVDGAGAEVFLMVKADLPILLTLVDSEGEQHGPFRLNDTEVEVLGPLNNSRATYEVLYDLVSNDDETVNRSVSFSLR